MKLQIPAKKKETDDSDVPWKEETIGTVEQVSDQGYLDKQLKKHKKEGTLERYCELLHAQIGSLAMKVINLSEQTPESDADKHIKKLRTHIASAVSELNEAVFYARDNID